MTQTKVIKELQTDTINSVNVAHGDMKLLIEATKSSARTVALVVNSGHYSTLRHRMIRSTAIFLNRRREALEAQLKAEVLAHAQKELEALKPEPLASHISDE